MQRVYSYRPEMGIRNSQPMRTYDALYQGSDDGCGIGWQVGMWFPSMAREEGVSRVAAGMIATALDTWMARFMMANVAKWETRNGHN